MVLTYSIVMDKARDYLIESFNIVDIEEGVLIKGVISRKKQIVPPIMSTLEKV